MHATHQKIIWIEFDFFIIHQQAIFFSCHSRKEGRYRKVRRYPVPRFEGSYARENSQRNAGYQGKHFLVKYVHEVDGPI